MGNMFLFHSDAGHGWLEVGLSDIQNLGLAGQISSYSKTLNQRVFLEEDLDAPLFLDAYEKKFNTKPDIVGVKPMETSFVRSLEPYVKEIYDNDKTANV